MKAQEEQFFCLCLCRCLCLCLCLSVSLTDSAHRIPAALALAGGDAVLDSCLIAACLWYGMRDGWYRLLLHGVLVSAGELMHDPWIASDGFSYERQVLSPFLVASVCSPNGVVFILLPNGVLLILPLILP